MTDETKQQRFDAVSLALLKAIPDVWAIYAYGSMVNGTEHDGSDLDLGVLMPPGKRIPDLLTLKASLSELAGREVDLADLRKAGNVLRREVLAKGVELYSAQRVQTLAWEAVAMSEYADHQFRIRDLLSDFNRTGIGYRQ